MSTKDVNCCEIVVNVSRDNYSFFCGEEIIIGVRCLFHVGVHDRCLDNRAYVVTIERLN